MILLFCLVLGSSAFLATGVAVIPGTCWYSQIRFPRVELNTGGDYSGTTGVFTCRVPGMYWFSATIMKLNDVDVDLMTYDILLNSNYIIRLHSNPVGDNDKAAYQMTGSVASHLTRGDRVSAYCMNADKIDNTHHTHFSGMLVRPYV